MTSQARPRSLWPPEPIRDVRHPRPWIRVWRAVAEVLNHADARVAVQLAHAVGVLTPIEEEVFEVWAPAGGHANSVPVFTLRVTRIPRNKRNVLMT